MIPLALPGRESWCAAPEHRVGPLLDRDPRASLGPLGNLSQQSCLQQSDLLMVLTGIPKLLLFEGWALVVIFHRLLFQFFIFFLILIFIFILVFFFFIFFAFFIFIIFIFLPFFIFLLHSLYLHPRVSITQNLKSPSTSAFVEKPLLSSVVPTDQLTIVSVQHVYLHGWGHLVSEIPAQKAELLKLAELKGSPLNHLRAAVALKD